jgi:hypothetical protein
MYLQRISTVDRVSVKMISSALYIPSPQNGQPQRWLEEPALPEIMKTF